MFSLSAKFRKSRTSGVPGSVLYVIRSGRTERIVHSRIKGDDSGILVTAKEQIAHDLMTIYCVIESKLESDGNALLEDVAKQSVNVINGGVNPYVRHIRKFAGKYRIDDQVVGIAKMYSDYFDRKRLSSSPKSRPTGLLGYLSKLIQEYTAAGKSYARSLRSTQLNLNRYLQGVDMSLDSITPEFILNYKSYLETRVTDNTTSFYLRVLRTVLRKAIADRLMRTRFVWPLSVRTSGVRSSRSTDGYVLDLSTLRRIEQVDLSFDGSLELARDMFVFGFYAQGMELTDIARLKLDNLIDNTLTYKRRGTGTEQVARLGNKAMEIVRKYRDYSQSNLFPIIARQWTYSYRTVQSQFANSLKKISEILGLPVQLRFSMNRYTWKSLLQEVNIAEILIS